MTSRHIYLVPLQLTLFWRSRWSIDIFCRELDLLYSAVLRGEREVDLPQLPIQYTDFTLWQREWIVQPECQEQLEFWARELADSRPAELLSDRQRPQTLSGTAGLVDFVIDGSLYEAVHAFAKSPSRSVTPFVVLLAAFRAVQFRLTLAEDATIGTPVANRNREELTGLIGLFVNTLCIRTRLQDDSFDELVQQVRQVYTAAVANQDAPFEQVVSRVLSGTRDLATSQSPLVQLIFAMHPQRNLCQFRLEGLCCETLPTAFCPRSDLEFHLFQGTGAWHGRVHYSKQLFDHETIEALVSCFQDMLFQCMENAGMPIADVPLSTRPGCPPHSMERTSYPRESSIVDIFQEQVKLCPDQTAVKDSFHMELTYAELDHVSSRLAVWLHQKLDAANPETIIGVLSPRSSLTIVAFVAILKAHFAYLPLDVNAPPGRHAEILKNIPVPRLVLLGPGVSAPDLKTDVECVPIPFALQQMQDSPASLLRWHLPGPTSLAYVIFTSGSTGKPKGVMIEHRGVVRLVKDNQSWHQVPDRACIAHMSNIVFDVSTWEIYSAILNGGCAVCVDQQTVLDPEALGKVFEQEGVQAAKITPVVLKNCLAVSPKTLSRLAVLYVAGDRVEISTCVETTAIVSGGFWNAYGPTENTGASTAYRIDTEDDLRLRCRVPIGSPISNSGAYVMDRRQRTVAAGVIGELVVTGDGLARGYLDSAQDVNRFVTVDIDGEQVRAYRTGDNVRQRPKDGQIEFLGRGDQQVKIRGVRIELEEVDAAIVRHEEVGDAITIVNQTESSEPEIIGFATLRDESCSELNEDEQQVDDWTVHFDGGNFASLDAIEASDVGRDFIGWKSMYDGSDIPQDQMKDWLDDTIATILDNQPAGHVLEIGTGTGMVLFNLGDGLTCYTGMEPSEKAGAYISQQAKSIPSLGDKVHMFHGTALDVLRLRETTFDTVILNSVVQYFPSRQYLETVLDRLFQLSGIKRIFFGDVRAHALHKHFLAAKTIRVLGESASKTEALDYFASIDKDEEELLLDPAFFTRLMRERPDLVEHVEILPKLLRSANELSSFRYAAVLHMRDSERGPRAARTVDAKDWLCFQDRIKNGEGLKELLLSSNGADDIAIAGIPDAHIAVERQLLAAMQTENEEAQNKSGWLGRICNGVQRSDALSPTDVCDIANSCGYQVEISWARMASQHGAFDALFHRDRRNATTRRTLVRFPFDDPTPPMTNRPLQQHRKRRIESELHGRLRDSLPSYMLPSHIILLDRFPVSASGKVDRRALATIATRTPKKTMTHAVMPRNEVEEGICEEFQQLLGVSVGVTDNFFEVGGHSILATRLAARLSRRFSAKVHLGDIFSHPVIEALAEAIATSRKSEGTTQISKAPVEGPWKLSFAQERLWFLDQLQHNEQNASTNVIPSAARVRGPLNIQALRIALSTIVERHDNLRSTFQQQDSGVVQFVHDEPPLSFNVVEVSINEAKVLLQNEQTMPFNLSAQPAWRMTVYRILGQGTELGHDHVLSFTMHHLIGDGWSISVFCRELAAHYKAACLDQKVRASPLTHQYRDFASWQRETQTAKHQEQLSYWTAALSDSCAAELQSDHQRPKVLGSGSTESDAAGVVDISMEAGLCDAVMAFAKRRGITPFVVLLSAFRAAHYRFTGADDATIGTPVAAGREQPELADVIGLFVNMLCTRLQIEDSTSFGELVEQTHERHTAGVANQDVPFQQIVAKILPGERDLSRHPLVQMVFALHSQKDIGFHFDGLECDRLPVLVPTRLDVEFHLVQLENRWEGHIFYSRELFEAQTLKCFATTFQEILRRGIATPSTPIADMQMTDGLSFLRAQGVLASPKPSAYPRDASIVDMFREQVKTIPDAVAIIDPTFNKQMTYMELEVASDDLASRLREHGLVPETLIAVLAPRAWSTITAFMGIMKAGLAYLPLDINAPAGRLESILGSVPGKRIVLLGPDVAQPRFNLDNVEYINTLDALRGSDTSFKKSSSTSENPPTAESLSHVMFTSGSTGKPKGVMITHRGIVRLVKENSVTMTDVVPPRPRIAHLSNLAFDVSTWECYTALLNGGAVICVDHHTVLDPVALGRLFGRFSIQVAGFTPALLKHCLASSPGAISGLETLNITGDRFDPSDCRMARGLFKGVLINAYGPAENSCLSTVYKVTSQSSYADIVPIGRAIDNTGVYIVDRQRRLVSTGVIGELIVTGDGLARGYTDEDLNKDRFIDFTFDSIEMRAYCAGDLARYRSDGEIEFLGRRDGQLKIRGHRLEIAEVEQAILRTAMAQDCAIVVRKREGEEASMVAFVTADASKGPIKAKIQKSLRAYLPNYMIPAVLIELDQLPMNANGKVDRKELASRVVTLAESASLESTGTVSTPALPRNSVEAAMCEALSEVLGHPVGIWDNFFEIGGHSLLAMKVITRLNRQLSTNIRLSDLFNFPVVADLATKIRPQQASYTPIPRYPDSTFTKLSFPQSRLWALEQLGAGTSAYHIPVTVRLRGSIDLQALQQAIDILIERHESLRTTFHQEEELASGVQIVHPHASHQIMVVDLAAQDVTSTLQQQLLAAFDLSKQTWRICILRIGPEDHILSIVMHHICTDALSVDILSREMSICYSAAVHGTSPQLSNIPVRYRDFASWQQDEQQTDHQANLHYWSDKLTDSCPAEFLCDFQRPQILSGAASHFHFDFDFATHKELLRFASSRNVTTFAILLAAFRATHYRMTAVEDATIGTPTAGRDREELMGVVGFFVNLHCLRIPVQEQSFDELVQQVRDIHMAAVEHDMPFEQIVSKVLPGTRDVSRNPLAQVIFSFHSQHLQESPILEGLQCEALPPAAPTARFDIELHVHQREDALTGDILFSSELFDSTSMEALAFTFKALLKQALAAPTVAIGDLPLLEDSFELRRLGLLDSNITDYPRDSSIIDVFNGQIDVHPDHVAVKDRRSCLTYAELDKKSTQLSLWLLQCQLPPQSIVGIFAPRSCSTVVAILGILKAGLAYLPLDVRNPAARIGSILSSIHGQRLVLVGTGLQPPDTGLSDVRYAYIEEVLKTHVNSSSHDTTPMQAKPTATDLAYVMYTSGSTGKPKGVMIEHRGIVNLVKRNTALGQVTSDMSVAHLASIAFDASTWEIWTALLNGATLVCVDHETILDISQLSQTFENECIQATLMPTALFRQCMDLCPQMIRQLALLNVGAERVTAGDAASLWNTLPDRAFNLYGPTEATVACTAHKIAREDYPTHGPPIGRAIDNSSVFVMDAQLRLVPLGVMGELFVSGDGLARGYLDDTASQGDHGRFLNVDIDGRIVRAYRTGDRARWRPSDGQLEHFGRITANQVKIRGHRVELLEVEDALRACTLVKDVAVVFDEAGGNLVAHVVPDTAMGKTSPQQVPGSLPSRIRHEVQARVPHYMVPSGMLFWERLPMNASCKVDRQALLRESSSGAEAISEFDNYVAPRNELERAMCEEFASVLDRVRCGVNDSFFELGGHSLLAIKLAARMSRRFNASISGAQIFEYPVVSDLASQVRQGSALFTPIAKEDHAGGSTELSFAQGRLWFMDKMRLGSSQTSYTIPLAVRLTGDLNLAALAAAFHALEQRHEVLRTTFSQQGGVGMQTVHSNSGRHLQVIDLSPQGAEDLAQMLRDERSTGFDLEKEVAWRALVIRVGKNEHVLSIVMHHIISDAWSVGVLAREITSLYTAATNGLELQTTLEPLPIQYRDFALWQRRTEQHDHQKAQLKYWKDHLANSTAAEFPCDRPRPEVLSNEAAESHFSIDGALYESLKRFCRTFETTPFIALLAAFRAAHYRLTGANDANIGTPIANRNRVELDNLIGFFVNIQCMRIVVDEDVSFQDLVRQVRNITTAALANQDTPFEQIVSELLPGSRDASRNPLVQVIFAVNAQIGLDELQLKGCIAEPLVPDASTRYDVEVHLFQAQDQFKGVVTYSQVLFDPETISNMVSVFCETLRRGMDSPELSISDIPLNDQLPILRSHGLLAVQQTPYERDASIVDIFSQQARLYPDAIAVQDSAMHLTYAELDRLSGRLATWLHQHAKIVAESVVAVLAPRSCYLIVALLGILKANCAYLPLSVHAPLEHVKSILSSASDRLRHVFTGTGLSSPWDPSICRPIADALTETAQKPLPSWQLPSASSLAYVIFTSGSTGKPKGVMVEHRGIVRLARHSVATDAIPPGARAAHLSNPAFDASIWETFLTLLKGGTLVCIEQQAILDGNLGRLFKDHQIQVATLTPALLKQCLIREPEALTHLDILYVAGDLLDGVACTEARRLVPGNMYNAYGPTENSIASTIYCIPKDQEPIPSIPIGTAISNSGAYVMDRQRRPVSPGVLGELVVTGDGLARGYTDQGLDVNRFVELVVEGHHTRAYCTGDLVRYKPNNSLIEFVGRLDGQVKVRGQRVEVKEIEYTLLRQHDLVGEAVVVLAEPEGRDLSLVGFITVRSGHSRENDNDHARAALEDQIIKRLQSQLPSYMVPARVVILEHMPLNTNGKVDRRALVLKAAMLPKRKQACIKVEPRGPIESAVCQVFAEILHAEVGVEDNFFDLGGHSLTAAALAVRLSDHFQVELSVREVFESSSPAELASKIEKKDRRDRGAGSLAVSSYKPFQLLPDGNKEAFVDSHTRLLLPDDQDCIQDVYPVTHLQKVHLKDPETGRIRQPATFYLDFPPETDIRRLKEGCAELIQRLDILRTVFVSTGRQFYQVVFQSFVPNIEAHDVDQSDVETVMDSIQTAVQDAKNWCFGKPLLKFSILNMRASGLRLVLHISHALYDGLSLQTLVHALHALYQGAQPPVLPGFARYMAYVDSTRLDGHLYWRKLLHKSSMTILDERNFAGVSTMSKVEKTLRMPSNFLIEGVTPATAFTAACALMLAKESGVDDVVFGRVVSGRQNLPQEDRHVVGPCTNAVPVRLRTSPDADLQALLRAVQEQYLECIPFETLDFDNIKENCTDWPEDLPDFGCLTEFLSFDRNPKSEVDGQQVRLNYRVTDEELINDLIITGAVEDDGKLLGLSIVAKPSCRSQKAVERMLEDLCEFLESLTTTSLS